MPKHDNFLVDSVRPKQTRSNSSISYSDGFRFGLGFFVSGLLITVILGGMSWGLIALLHLG